MFPKRVHGEECFVGSMIHVPQTCFSEEKIFGNMDPGDPMFQNTQFVLFSEVMFVLGSASPGGQLTDQTQEAGPKYVASDT